MPKLRSLKWKRVRLRDFSRIKWRCWTADDPVTEQAILRLAFKGEYGFGCKGNPDATYMDSVISAALTAWEPEGVILDFRGLRYEWGDEMAGVLFLTSRFLHFVNAGGGLTPTVVITSDLCLEGLTSLVAQEMRECPAEWLFDNPKDAVTHLRAQMSNPRKQVDR